MKKLIYSSIILLVCLCNSVNLYAQNFIGPELLGRPTNNSITINVVIDQSVDVRFQYGPSTGNYTMTKGPFTTVASVPLEAVMDGLSADSRYFYRVQYSTNSGSTWISRDEHTFHTQRNQGSDFTFTIISDSHLNNTLGNNVSLYTVACRNVEADQPSFIWTLVIPFLWMTLTTALTEHQTMGRQQTML